MKEENKSLEKILMIEKRLNEMVTLREQIAELKAWEADRQSAMKELQASEKKLKALVENIPQKLYMKDKDSAYVFVNEKYAADLKRKAGDICGKTDHEFFPKDWAEKYVSDDRRVMTTGQAENIEEGYVLDGQTFTVHTVKTPVKDEKGETVGILGIFWDITEQKRKEEEGKNNGARQEGLISHQASELLAVNEQLQGEIAARRGVEQQLQAADAMFWAFFENTGTASVMIGEDLVIFLANREFEKLSGYSKVELEGKKNLTEFLPAEAIENIKGVNLAGRASLDTVLRDYECQFNGQGKNRMDIRITAITVPRAKKAMLSLLDITELKQAQESLRTLQEKYQAPREDTSMEHDLLVQSEFQAIEKQMRVSSLDSLRNLFNRRTEADRGKKGKSSELT